MLRELFIDPLLLNGFFNPANTAIFAVVLIAAVYLVYRFLMKLGVKTDRYFALSIMPYILFATSMRVFRDLSFTNAKSLAMQAGTLARFQTDLAYQFSQIQQAGMERILSIVPDKGFASAYSSIMTIFPTPGSYVITFVFAFLVFIASFGASRLLARKGVSLQYWKLMVIPPLAFSALNLALLPFSEFAVPVIIVVLTAAATGITFGLVKLFSKWRPSASILLGWKNQAIMAAHFLDASATYFAIQYLGYGEQHFVPRFLFEAAGPWVFFLLKPMVVLPILWIIDRDKSDRNFTNFIKIVILILGASPGLRSLIRLAVGHGV